MPAPVSQKEATEIKNRGQVNGLDKHHGKSSHNDSGIDQDQSMDGPLTPMSPDSTDDDSVFQCQSPTSAGSRDLCAELELRMRGGSVTSNQKREIDYGRFYTKSYLKPEAEQSYLKRGPTGLLESTHQVRSPQSFIKPDNFSYSKNVQYGKAEKKGAMGVLMNSISKKKVKCPKSPELVKNEEAVKLSQYPGGDKPKPNEISKIERDDWPAPPSPASYLSERVRERRKSKGDILDEDEEEEENPVDPKIQREIDEIKKLTDESSISRVIVKDLTKKVEIAKHKIMDPRSASRTPSADHEPYNKPRFESPMFASPSRLNVERPHSRWVDREKELSPTQKICSLPHTPAVKPGYTYGLASGSRSVTLPAGTLGNFSFKDIESDEDGREQKTRARSSSNSSLNTTENSISKQRHSSSYHTGLFDEPNFISSTLGLERKALFSTRDNFIHEADQTYTLEELQNPSQEFLKVVDKNCLEKYLNKDDFEETFRMKRDEFYRQPEWKRNDLKRKIRLF